MTPNPWPTVWAPWSEVTRMKKCITACRAHARNVADHHFKKDHTEEPERALSDLRP
jgi:hypothetical protein